MTKNIEVLKRKSASLSAIRHLMKHSGITIEMLIADQFLLEWQEVVAAANDDDESVIESDDVARDIGFANCDGEDFSTWMEDLNDLTAKFLFYDGE